MKIHLKMFSLARNQSCKCKLKVDLRLKSSIVDRSHERELHHGEMTNLKSFSRRYISKKNKESLTDFLIFNLNKFSIVRRRYY